ncbi:hypothetical protein CW304_12005 [Bacillus sp. UFRGS-B20]|nr:hypothetical protein CW304_12005 [Bacillus sp. UFRGS-B20]
MDSFTTYRNFNVLPKYLACGLRHVVAYCLLINNALFKEHHGYDSIQVVTHNSFLFCSLLQFTSILL